LQNTKDALLSGKDELAVYARELGFAKPEERFIRIVGLPDRVMPAYQTGKIYIPYEPDFIRDRTLKSTSLIVCLVLFLFSAFVDLLKYLRTV
jgi:hypothetical protein